MTTDLQAAPHLDLVRATAQGGLAASFPKSRSGAYAPAVAICRGASEYQETEIEGVPMHFAVFGTTAEDMARALAAVTTLRGYKGLLLCAGGKLQGWARAMKVLQCYADSAACNDPKAHCVVAVEKDSVTARPLSSSISITPDFLSSLHGDQPYLFPCRLLAYSFGFKLQSGHPSSEADQIQAGAVREGCNWCPSFRPTVGRT